MAIKISNVAARKVADALTVQIDAGAAVSKLIIYDGARPADCEVAVTTQLNLVEFELPDPCFQGAVDNSASGARATANAITPATVSQDGTATWFRLFDGDGNALMDGTVTDQSGAGDLKLSDVELVTDIQVQVFSFTITQPEG